jgi:pyruvate-ferredoxin/flavodoxin oxidoreductase
MAGKAIPKKDLGMLAMAYGNVYVAQVAFGAKDQQTIKAFAEADAYPGPSIIIAYSHCIAHGFELSQGCNQQKSKVEAGAWPLYRFDPTRIPAGEPPLTLDSGAPKGSLREYMLNETRFRMVEKMDPKRFGHLMEYAERDAHRRKETYEQMAKLVVSALGGTQAASTTSEDAE